MKWFGRTPRDASRGKNRRSSRPDLLRLEDRSLMTIQGIWGYAKPQILPNNGKYVPVHVWGEVVTSQTKQTPLVSFQVIDLYRQNQPYGNVKLKKVKPGDFTFDFTIRLQASHSPTFTDARLYSLTLGYQDSDNGAGKTLPIIVPNPADVPKPTTSANAKARARR